MNARSPVNDDEVLGAVRGSLTAVRDSLDGVRMERPVEALVARGRARRARRALAVRAAVACGTAAVTAAAVVVVTVTGGSGAPAGTAPGSAPTQAVAYAIQRVENALAEKNIYTQNKVVQTEYTFSPAFPPIMQWSYRASYSTRQSGFMPPASVKGLPWAQGQESWGTGTATINGKLTYVQVDYRRHEWYPTSAFLVLPNGCSSDLDLAEFNPTDWMTYVRQTLSCGEFKIAGHARVNGQMTIKITGSTTRPNWWAGVPHAEGRGGMQVDATLYVDPSTYVPVRVLWRNVTHWRDGKPLVGMVRADIRMLPPTPANVAQASVPIPAGFRRVPDASFGGPLFQFYG
jgi:hypothetical protein